MRNYAGHFRIMQLKCDEGELPYFLRPFAAKTLSNSHLIFNPVLILASYISTRVNDNLEFPEYNECTSYIIGGGENGAFF